MSPRETLSDQEAAERRVWEAVGVERWRRPDPNADILPETGAPVHSDDNDDYLSARLDADDIDEMYGPIEPPELAEIYDLPRSRWSPDGHKLPGYLTVDRILARQNLRDSDEPLLFATLKSDVLVFFFPCEFEINLRYVQGGGLLRRRTLNTQGETVLVEYILLEMSSIVRSRALDSSLHPIYIGQMHDECTDREGMARYADRMTARAPGDMAFGCFRRSRTAMANGQAVCFDGKAFYQGTVYALLEFDGLSAAGVIAADDWVEMMVNRCLNYLRNVPGF